MTEASLIAPHCHCACDCVCVRVLTNETCLTLSDEGFHSESNWHVTVCVCACRCAGAAVYSVCQIAYFTLAEVHFEIANHFSFMSTVIVESQVFQCLIVAIKLKYQYKLHYYNSNLHMFLLWHWTVQQIFAKPTISQHSNQQSHGDNLGCQCWDEFWSHSTNNRWKANFFIKCVFELLYAWEHCFIMPLIALNQKICPENEDGSHHI